MSGQIHMSPSAHGTQVPGMPRRTMLGGLAATIALVAAPGSLRAFAADGEIVLVADGMPRAQLVIAADAPTADLEGLNAAADLIVEVVREATGVIVPVGRDEPATLLPIYLGHRGGRTSERCTVDGLIRDGFCTEYSAAAITLLGAGVFGTWCAAVDLTERVVGAAHVLPGEHGTAVPELSGVAAVPALIRANPDFQDRRIFNFGQTGVYDTTNPNSVFGNLTRGSSLARYSHAMTQVYPPSVYAETLPEIYPVRDGVRHIPASDTSNAGWNPRWQDPVTLQPAIDYVVEKLAVPGSPGWVAMGMNDNGGYSDDTVALGGTDSDGLFSLSNVFCDWLSKVAEGVEAVVGHQDFRLGFLAYNDVRSAPDFDLHPSLVPYITRDLFGWTDDGLAEHDRELVAQWAARARSLGWWDYAWGTPIMIPRLYHRAQQRALQHLRDHNVDHIFVEMDQNLGDAAKPALYGALLWDADIDIDRARDDWCRQAGGAAAGPHLMAFDQLWNDFWTDVMPTTEYGRGGKGMSYYWRFDTDYLNHVSDHVIDTSQAHLDAALAATETPAQRARVEIVHRQHEYYRASVKSYDRTLPRPQTVAEAVRLLRRLIGEVDERVGLAQRREELTIEFRSDPILRHRREGPASGMRWNGWPLKPMWDIATMMREHGRGRPARALWALAEQERDRTPSEEVRGWLDLLLTVAEGRTRNLVVNGDFAEDTTEPWQIDTGSGWPGGEPTRTTEVRRVGPGSLRVVGPTKGGAVLQTVPAKPGFLRSSFWIRVTPTDNPFGLVTNTWIYYGPDGKRVGLQRGESLALETDMGSWRELTMLRMLPEGVATVACYMSFMRLAAQTEIHVADISYTQTEG